MNWDAGQDVLPPLAIPESSFWIPSSPHLCWFLCNSSSSCFPYSSLSVPDLGLQLAVWLPSRVEHLSGAESSRYATSLVTGLMFSL